MVKEEHQRHWPRFLTRAKSLCDFSFPDRSLRAGVDFEASDSSRGEAKDTVFGAEELLWIHVALGHITSWQISSTLPESAEKTNSP
jgi:hypothetical protein